MATSTSRGASKPAEHPGGIRRIALLAALAAAALLMLRDSLAYVLRPIDPALALRINPRNAEVAASRAEQMLREDPSSASQAEALARRALARSPVSAAGARMLATTRDLAGDTAAARRLMVYAESLSRRDLPTQLWLIEQAIQRNDIAGALHHYDIALRSSEATKPLLFPILAKAIAQPAIVDGLIGTLSARPLWADPFLENASATAQDMNGLALLLAGLARRGYPVPLAAADQATVRMVDAKSYALAWQVYTATHPGTVRGRLRSPAFGQDSGSPFAWTIISGNGLFAEPRIHGGYDTVGYTAATGAGGVIARQLLVLPAGAFRITGRAFDIAPNSPPPQVRLSCADNGQPLLSVAVDAPSFARPLTVPASCHAQWLELFVEGGDNPLGASGAIGDLHVLPGSKGARP